MKMKKQRVICLLLVFTMMLGCFGGITLTSTESKAATKNFSVFTKFQRTGKVTKISTNYAYYKTQKSSSPLRYDKTRKIAFTSNTKFYKCKGVTQSGSAFKTQCISKSTAIKEIKNKSRNYVFFKVKNGKATTVLYGMENYFS